MQYEHGVRPAFIVCLAAYNGIKWLPEQLASICTQIDVDIAIYISVDKSSDGTEDWVDMVAATDMRVHVLAHGMLFGGAARNFFRLIRDVDFSKCAYVCYADQDDIWEPDKLSRAHMEMQKSGCDAYSSNVTAFWPDGRKLLVEKSQPQVRWDFLFEAAGPGCTYVLKNNVACALQATVIHHWNELQQVGLHDWFSYAFARANGYKWLIDPMPTMLYRQHDANQYGVNAGWRAIGHRAAKVLSGWGLAQSALIAGLVGLGDHPFTVRWKCGQRLGLLTLALHAGLCRRRLRDKFIFCLSCMVLSLIRGGRS